MKLSALRLLLGVALVLVCLFYLQPSRAYQTSSPNLTPLQDQPKPKQIAQMIEDSKKAGVRFQARNLFQSVNNQLTTDTKLQQVLSNGVKLSLDKSVTANLLREKIDYLTLPLSNTEGGTVELELVRVNIFAPGFSVKTSLPTTESIQESLGIHYRGIVKGNTRSLAAISVFKNEIMGFYSTGTDGNTVIGRLGGDNPTDTHLLYEERDLKVSSDFQCDAIEPPRAPPPELSLQDPLANATTSCVRLYVEADHSLFLNKGSVSNTTSYLTSLFNQSATLFSNDGVSISLSEIFVWNSASPYDGTTSNDVLDQFKATRTSFNGDLAHLVTVNRRFGGIAFRGVLCFRSFAYGVSDVHSTFNDVPIYSWSVGVITHEVGHNLGSRHTHACAWNGDSTAIDGCAAPEGSCAQPELPTDGGTIMSYCHLLPSVGINFTHGFGPQPRDVITVRVDGAACLTSCSAGFTIGQDAPNPQLFIDAANRGGFLQFALQPPTSAVYRWDCTTCDPNNPTWGKGLIQDFDDVTPGIHDALMLADTNTNFVAQIYGGMWDKFIQLGGLNYSSSNTRMIGYPIADRNCSDFNATCFSDSQLISPAFNTQYHYQRFQGGAFVMHRSNSRSGQTFEIHGAIRARWQALGGPDSSTYGLPISDEYAWEGKRRSDFEGGSICYNPATNQTEDTCTSTVAAPTANAATSVTDSSFTANWSSVSGATGYRLDVSTSSNFSSFVSGYSNLDVGNVLNRSVTGLNAGTSYFYRVRAYNSSGTSGNSATIATSTTQSFSVTVSASPVDGGTVTGGGTFPAGSSRTVHATANSGYSFTSWTEGLTVASSSSSFTFTLNSNRVLVANFRPRLQLLLEQSGPTSTQLAVFDSLLMRDPFAVVNAANPFNLTLDKNTRVILFVANLQPGETPSAVVVNLVASNNQSYDVTAEALVPLANSPFTQVTFRLPDNLVSGTCTVIVKWHGEVSNAGTMRIK